MDSYAIWAAAASTTAAVITALYLGLRNDTERLTARLLLRTFQLDVMVANPTSCLSIVNSMTFEVGRFRAQEIYQVWGEDARAMQRLPADVNPHESIRLSVGYSPNTPGSLPDQMHQALQPRKWFDRDAFVVIETATLARFRFRMPRRIVRSMLGQLASEVGS